jgi:hypothetical protein
VSACGQIGKVFGIKGLGFSVNSFGKVDWNHSKVATVDGPVRETRLT